MDFFVLFMEIINLSFARIQIEFGQKNTTLLRSGREKLRKLIVGDIKVLL
jgi:hypothetical protein